MSRCALALLVVLVACKASSVGEAERSGDIRYLVKAGTPEAVAALGRLADSKPAALAALEARASSDLSVYIAAWDATVRGASWGPAMLRAGLADAQRAELAAMAMQRKDPHLEAFAADLDRAIALTHGTGQRPASTTSLLASMGAVAQPYVRDRLADDATRDVMCRGLASVDSSPESRATFMHASPASRDGASCLRAVAEITQLDDDAITWLGAEAESGLIGAASKEPALKCERLAKAWNVAFDKRTPGQHLALAVPLSEAIKRCPTAMDAPLSAALDRGDADVLVLSALSPADTGLRDMRGTCARLPLRTQGKLDARLRERARDALALGCGTGR